MFGRGREPGETWGAIFLLSLGPAECTLLRFSSNFLKFYVCWAAALARSEGHVSGGGGVSTRRYIIMAAPRSTKRITTIIITIIMLNSGLYFALARRLCQSRVLRRLVHAKFN